MNDLMVQDQPDVSLEAQARCNVVYTPRFDIRETDEEVLLSGDLPGVTADGLDIRFENKVLTIWGKVAQRTHNVRYWAQEYGVGDFYRTFALGDSVDADSISAELKDGVLTIHLPKKAEARPRRIAVKAS